MDEQRKYAIVSESLREVERWYAVISEHTGLKFVYVDYITAFRQA